MAPTEESLSGTAGPVRHGVFPGDARDRGRAPCEGREILRSRYWLRGFPGSVGWALPQNDRCFRGIGDGAVPRLAKPVILREAPRRAFRPPESMAPTEESLSGTAGPVRHGVFPGDARERVPREGREILRSRYWLRGFPGSAGWALPQNDRCFRGIGDGAVPRLAKPVILREAPRSTLRSIESMAPTEESLSGTAGPVRHGVFPGDARERAPREGREILRSRYWLRGFPGSVGWALPQNDRFSADLGWDSEAAGSCRRAGFPGAAWGGLRGLGWRIGMAGPTWIVDAHARPTRALKDPWTART
jgi:hypothetical protein